MRTAVDSTPAPETARTSTGVPPSGSSSSGSAGRDDRVAAADPHSVAADPRHRPLALGGERQRAAVVPAVGGRDVGRARAACRRSAASAAARTGRRCRPRPRARRARAYSPGPSNAVDRRRSPRPVAPRSSGADVARTRRRPGTPSRARARAAPPARRAAANVSVRVRSGLHSAPPSSTGAGSAGAVLSTRTVRATQVQLPPASCAPSRSACAPSAHPRVSSAAPIAPFEQGTGRVKSHGARVVVHDAPVELDAPEPDAAVVGGVERDVLRRRAASRPPRSPPRTPPSATARTRPPGTRARCAAR